MLFKTVFAKMVTGDLELILALKCLPKGFHLMKTNLRQLHRESKLFRLNLLLNHLPSLPFSKTPKLFVACTHFHLADNIQQYSRLDGNHYIFIFSPGILWSELDQNLFHTCDACMKGIRTIYLYLNMRLVYILCMKPPLIPKIT